MNLESYEVLEEVKVKRGVVLAFSFDCVLIVQKFIIKNPETHLQWLLVSTYHSEINYQIS